MSHRLLALLALLSLVATPAPRAAAEVQTKLQRRCAVALDKAAIGVARVAVKRLARCLRAAATGRLPPGTTAEQCLAADRDGRLADAEARVSQAQIKSCTTLPLPSIGPTAAAAVNAAFGVVGDPHAVFGPDLDAAVIDARADRAGAACQAAVATAMARLAIIRLRVFDKCAAAGLANGSIDSSDALEGCVYADPAGTVARATALAGRRVAGRCAGTAIAAAFPGACAATPAADLFACTQFQVDCDLCTALNAADRMTHGCHRFANGVATSYCGTRPSTTQSAARQWNEETLAAIRIDLPRPPVHAKNLFYGSVAMWDAWAAYDATGTADAFLHAEAPPSSDPAGDREIAISFAAYRVLAHLYRLSVSAATTEASLAHKMAELGFDKTFTTTSGDTPAAVGNRIAAAVIAYGLTDGSNEAGNYQDPGYAPVNEPLIVKLPGLDPTLPGTAMADPNHWQPLALDFQVSQNGIPLPNKVQVYVGSQWNDVKPFALTRSDPADVYLDPGAPPKLGGVGDAEYKDGTVQLIQFSHELDPTDPTMLDISPASWGHNTLGTNDGTGYPLNPVTGAPYVSQLVKRADFERVLAEFWADGPDSETPPGHWNVIANYVSDQPSTVKRIGGVGAIVDDLEWDVKLYLALNGAVHDAAVAAWGIKRKYDSVRPISQVRYMGGLGQSSDPLGPSYDPSGLPLVPGLIEVITPESSAPGERHAALAAFVGEVALNAWPGEPADPATQFSPSAWIRAKNWVPYQRKTFVTPPFASFLSGHSTFSRAGAEVLTSITGSPYFPGGLGEYVAPANSFLKFEVGPTTDVRLQWASYYDASDQAGISRLYGGIHPRVDDLNGRVVGSEVGITAWNRAQAYFDGSAVP